ncbi:MAG: hypothetical protein IT193_20025 [Propionibacteriaceae bacterium]|nr:hypothetical protein [Propionibacteriaceae bacterium]
MTTVTQYYGITKDVPFLDVNVYDDNRLFVDPFAVRQGLGPATWAAAANFCTETFFDEITRSVISSRPAQRRKGQRLLQRFEEPRETRLGMSKFGFDGHGGADGVGSDIWDVLTGDAEALVRVGVFKQVEDLPLFVPGVGNDITSDLTTRVIFEPLVDFTGEMVNLFPELAGRTGIRRVLRQVWDPLAANWTDKLVDLPTVDGHPLLLVPKPWTRHNLTLNATRFYDTALLSHVQLDRAVRSRDGKLLKTPKDRLREDASLKRSYETIIRIVEAAYGNDRSNLVSEFKRWAQERYQATSDSQVRRYTA